MPLLRVGQGLQQGLDLVLERFLRAVARFILSFQLPRELGLRRREGVARRRRDLRRVPRPLCLLYTSPSPRDKRQSRMPSSA